MKKILLAMALIFSVNAVYAADPGKSWFDTLLKGLKTNVQKKLESKNRVSAVAAVRGAKQGGDARALYWKGGVSDEASKKLDAERKQFADAVQLVADGNVPAGRAALEKFTKDNPDSVFLPDARDALDKLPAAEAKPAQAAKQPAVTAAPASGTKTPAAEPAPGKDKGEADKSAN